MAERGAREVRFIDEGGALSPAERRPVEQAVAGMPGAEPVEVIVMIVPAVPERRFRDAAVAARRRHSRDASRSILILVATLDRHVEVATAPRWADRLDAVATKALLDATFVPAMRAGSLETALVATVQAMGGRLGRGAVGPPAAGGRWRGWILPATGVVVAALFWIVGYVREHRCRECGHWGRVDTEVIVEATTLSEGSERVRFRCGTCTADYTETRTIARRSSGSSDSWSDSGGSSDSGSDGGGGSDW